MERSKRFDRKVDAEKWLDSNSADITRAAWVDPAAGKVTLDGYANQWLAGRTDLRATTFGNTEGYSIDTSSPRSVRFRWPTNLFDDPKVARRAPP